MESGVWLRGGIGHLSGPVRRSMCRVSLLRRLGAFYALAFLFAVAAAPHRHLNSVEDLLSDGLSDSGFFIEGRGADASREARVSGFRLMDDDPCLACFHHDYAASASVLFVLGETFRPLQRIPPLPGRAIPEPVTESPASRSPPNLS